MNFKNYCNLVVLATLLGGTTALAKTIEIQCDINTDGDAVYTSQYSAHASLTQDTEGKLSGTITYAVRPAGTQSEVGAETTVEVTGSLQSFAAGEDYNVAVDVIQLKNEKDPIAYFSMTLGTNAVFSSRAIIDREAEHLSKCSYK